MKITKPIKSTFWRWACYVGGWIVAGVLVALALAAVIGMVMRFIKETAR